MYNAAAYIVSYLGSNMKPMRMMLLLFMMGSLTHCLSYDLSRRFTQQGTLLPAARVQRLKIGMSKKEVQQLLGNTLTQDVFNPNRLDYAYTFQKGAHLKVLKYVALTFQKDRLVEIKHYP